MNIPLKMNISVNIHHQQINFIISSNINNSYTKKRYTQIISKFIDNITNNELEARTLPSMQPELKYIYEVLVVVLSKLQKIVNLLMCNKANHYRDVQTNNHTCLSHILFHHKPIFIIFFKLYNKTYRNQGKWSFHSSRG